MKTSERGFSAIEAILVVVVVALIGSVGYISYHRHHKTDKTNTAATSQKAPAGTSASVDDLTAQDENDESSIDNKYANSYQSTATSTDQAAANVGGAYNESNF